jgi:predicted ATPase
MGKSALVAHFLDDLRADGAAAVLAGRCYERESVPFKAFDSIVDDLSRFLRRLRREEAAELMPREVYALARLFPVLDRVESVAAAPKKDVPDVQELQQRAFAAFGELLGRVRDRRPLVLFIDDLQWACRDSTVFMVYLLTMRRPAALQWRVLISWIS